MGVSHTFGFNSQQYRLKYQALSTDRIYQKYRLKTRTGNAHKTVCSFSALLLIPSAGISAISLCYSLRQTNVTTQMQSIIQEELAKRGHPPCIDLAGDAALGCGIGLLGVICIPCGIELCAKAFPNKTASVQTNPSVVPGSTAVAPTLDMVQAQNMSPQAVPNYTMSSTLPSYPMNMAPQAMSPQLYPAIINSGGLGYGIQPQSQHTPVTFYPYVNTTTTSKGLPEL